MKLNATAHSPFLFNPETSFVRPWPTVRRKVRGISRPASLLAETQIESKQEVVCGAILVLCTLFGLGAFVAQFVLA